MVFTLIDRQRWRRQPTFPVLFDESHAAAPWVRHGYLFNIGSRQPIDVVRRTAPPDVSGTTSVALEYNVPGGGRFTAQGLKQTQTAEIPTASAPLTLQGGLPSKLTVLAHARRDGTISTTGIAGIVSSRLNSEANYFELGLGNRFGSAGQKNGFYYGVGGSAVGSYAALDGVVSASAYLFPGVQVPEYQDIVGLAAFSATAGSVYDLLITARGTSGGYLFPTTLYSYFDFDAVLPEALAGELTLAPYSPLRPRVMRSFYDMGGGAASAAVTPGQLKLAGAAGIKAGIGPRVSVTAGLLRLAAAAGLRAGNDVGAAVTPGQLKLAAAAGLAAGVGPRATVTPGQLKLAAAAGLRAGADVGAAVTPGQLVLGAAPGLAATASGAGPSAAVTPGQLKLAAAPGLKADSDKSAIVVPGLLRLMAAVGLAAGADSNPLDTRARRRLSPLARRRWRR